VKTSVRTPEQPSLGGRADQPGQRPAVDEPALLAALQLPFAGSASAACRCPLRRILVDVRLEQVDDVLDDPQRQHGVRGLVTAVATHRAQVGADRGRQCEPGRLEQV
jgi:hypothetical protein